MEKKRMGGKEKGRVGGKGDDHKIVSCALLSAGMGGLRCCFNLMFVILARTSSCYVGGN